MVSKRVVRRAVDRSLLKRLVRETFRRRQQELAGFDVLVRPRLNLPADDLRAARAELRNLLMAAVE
jgi:ribonuclease P protein component